MNPLRLALVAVLATIPTLAYAAIAPAISVPTLGEWSLIGLAISVGSLGAWLLSRKQ